jgi:hypothetical protein
MNQPNYSSAILWHLKFIYQHYQLSTPTHQLIHLLPVVRPIAFSLSLADILHEFKVITHRHFDRISLYSPDMRGRSIEYHTHFTDRYIFEQVTEYPDMAGLYFLAELEGCHKKVFSLRFPVRISQM